MEKKFSQFNAKVLVAEDYLINRELIKEMLEMMHCEVDVVEDGIEAIKHYDGNKYDVIFMDIQMPKKDGIEATKEIREKELGKERTPIVALTANALQGDKEKYLEAGMDDFISKPLKMAELERVLQKFLKE